MLPLHDFDRKWRSIVPDVINGDATDVSDRKNRKYQLSDQEREGLKASHAAWHQQTQEAVTKKLSIQPPSQVSAPHQSSSLEPYSNTSCQDHELAEPVNETDDDAVNAQTTTVINNSDWLTARELYECVNLGGEHK